MIINLFKNRIFRFIFKCLKSLIYRFSSDSQYVNYTNNTIIDTYINTRYKNPQHTFDSTQIETLKSAFDLYKPKISYNQNAYIINPSNYPTSQFDSKDHDYFMIDLWNIIFPDYIVKSIEEIKPISLTIIEALDNKYPSGANMDERELLRYITAHSSSSFIGIQSESKSLFSLNSMKKTLTAHASYNVRNKPWLIDNLRDCESYVVNNNLMNRNYGDVCLFAKSSRTSIVGESRNFRDYVFENTLDDLIKLLAGSDFPPYVISAGKRNDRRGKFRLICSFHAAVRILDFLINNGSYALCSHGGLYSKYTTEGLSGLPLWRELVKMSFRDTRTTMVCLDFKGYDTQISLEEYNQISTFLNHYRINKGDQFSFMFDWFTFWINQPKFLISEGIMNSKDMLIPYYRTLASGLHGTHSFENLIGISYAKEAEKRGISVKLFKANGDDQNIMIDQSKIEDLMNFTSDYFDVEYSKSLIGHQLTVWSKKWFTRAVYPVIEIGTVRSVWERESGSSSFVEPSKFESNYCKIISLIIFLHRLSVDKDIILEKIKILCSQACIIHDQLPVRLQNLKQIETDASINVDSPAGLETAKNYLSDITVDTNLIGSSNVYELLRGMYRHKSFYDLNVTDAVYYPKDTELSIESNFDYSVKLDENIPWMLRDIKIYRLTEEQNLVRNVLQGTNSYDGPLSKSYIFTDMYSLAMAIHNRNLEIWSLLQSES